MPHSDPPQAPRRLHLFFEAGRTRYAIEAVAVAEVARPGRGVETLRGHLPLQDLSELLGGEREVDSAAAVVIDASQTVAVRVRDVGGVFDTSGDAVLPLSGRLIPLVSPAIRGAFLHEDALVFELDADGVGRGLPRQLKRPELAQKDASGPCLVFESGGQRLAVSLERVRHVVQKGRSFNAAPGAGAFCGVVAHLQHLCPVFRLSDGGPEPLIVLVEVRGELMGVCAAQAEGVKVGEALTGAMVLDVEQMFS